DDTHYKFMLSKLQNGTLLLLIFNFFISCINLEKDLTEKSGNTKNDTLLNRAIVNGYYFQVSENLGICIYNNRIYYLTSAETGFSEDNFMLHFVKENNTFINKDFIGRNYLINDTLFNKFKRLSIIEAPLVRDDYKILRTGQYVRLADNSTQNIWVKEIPVSDLEADVSLYNNQFMDTVGKNIIAESFELSLQTGTFLKNTHGFYILYDTDFIYVITKVNDSFKDKFMLHFINTENNFVNKSFTLGSQNFQKQLSPAYSNLFITRVRLPIDSFVKIRIGQFNSERNIWTQEFSPQEILSNPLLKYNNEFQK
ncbi:MAG: hypothetical protein K8L99_32240, partial [Anaerolineae bacterium]|nr:hypothetical protein [Anaerolineae bacterium]